MALDYQDINVEIVEENVIAAEISEVTIVAEIADVVEIQAEISEIVVAVNVIDEVVINADVAETEIIVVEVESWSGGGSSGGVGAGAIFITDVTSSGIVGDKEYEDDTVPANKVLTSALVDNSTATIHFQAEGGENYSPVVNIDGVECTNLVEVSGDLRMFAGSISVSLTQLTENFIVRSDTGTQGVVTIEQAEPAPEISSCVIGNYPGIQTAVKAGDIVHVTGTVDASATHVRLNTFGAYVDSDWVSCSNGTFDITGIIGSASGLQNAQVYARNSFGSEGGDYLSDNQILLDQIAPSFNFTEIIYPVGQNAFKGNEIGTVSLDVLNSTSVTYSSPNGDFTITDPLVNEFIKTISCQNPGNYNDNTINFRAVATKTINDTSNTYNLIVEVADTVPIITVAQPQSRLRSSDFGEDYVITATSNQNMNGIPDISIPVSGTWKGLGFVGGLKVFTREITIDDLDAKGNGSWLLNTPITNRAGLNAIITGSEVVGGFVSRDYILPAFSTTVWLGTEVVSTVKLRLNWSFKGSMTFQPVSTPPPVVNGYTISSIGINPTQIIILDTQAASASSQASTITIEEIV